MEGDYLADALEMMGEIKPKEIIHEISGYTPIFDVLVQRYEDAITPMVFGKAWRYCQMEDGVCKASLRRLATELGLDPSTVSRHLKILAADGYLKDLTPDARNVPHVYADTGRIVMRTATNVTVAHSNTSKETVAQGNRSVAHSKATVAQNAMKRVYKTDSQDTGREKPPAPDFASMTVEEAGKWPTLRLYRRAADFFPGSVVWEFVDKFITDNGLTEAKIHEAAVEWQVRGYRQENVKGILEWAAFGIPADKNAPARPVMPTRDPMEAYNRAMAKRRQEVKVE